MEDKKYKLEDIIKDNWTYKKYDKYEDFKDFKYDLDFWKDVSSHKKQKSQKEIWEEQLKVMDISVVEKFLRKKKLEQLSKKEK